MSTNASSATGSGQGAGGAPPWVAASAGRAGQLFPVLSDVQIEALRPLGEERHYKDGETLWDAGDRSFGFFVLLDGTVDIVHRGVFGEEALIRRHGRGEFTGEVSTLAGRAELVAARARGQARVLAVDRAGLRELVVTRADLSELIMRSFILRRMHLIAEQAGGVSLIGSRYAGEILRLQEFLTRNGHPHSFLDLEREEDVSSLLDRFEVTPEETPIVICGGEVLRNPTVRELADRLGVAPELEAGAAYDVAVVGAGPAGLAAAVYAASEGLKVVVVEPVAPGGQAGTSSKIENYLGFPTGISGQALAGRAFAQAEKFGAEVVVPRRVVRLRCDDPLHALELDGGEVVRARSVVVASGARYRKPQLENLERFEGAGVYYGATYVEGRLCGGAEVGLIGGGNSGGQAAVFLAGHARKLHMLLRGEGLAESMSRYLVRRIETTPNIELRTRTEVMALEGSAHLERVRWRDDSIGEEEEREIRHLFVFIGAEPNTDWVEGALALDGKGFIKTGQDLTDDELGRAGWRLERRPFLLETSCPGVFAAGDVRAGSVKRCASAVGEGSICIQFLHQVLGG